ncbi:MAG: S9 family peptidase [Tannerella sp.]|jgi:oligopeptidase B|nr:S9 family peptidase [Tannerella sp.]
MKKILLPIATVCFCACQQGDKPPVAKIIPHEMTLFDDTRVDNYYWMRLSDEQKSAATPDAQTQDVLDYISAENAYREAQMQPTLALQNELFEEMKGRIKQDESTAPYLDNGFWYWTKYEEGKEYPLYYRKADSEGAADELLLDVNRLAEGKKYCSVTSLSVSPDNKILAYAVDYVSRRRYTLHFIDLASGQLIGDSIPDCSGGVWANDSKTLFYVAKDIQTLRNYRVLRHTIGTPASADALCFEETDETFNISLDKSQSRKYILLESHQTLSTETLILDADHPEGTFKVFNPREADHLYSIDHINGTFYILSNKDALNFKLMKTAETATEEKNWQEVIAHRQDVLLSRLVLFNNFFAVSERQNGLYRFRIVNLKDGSEQFVPFAEEDYAVSFSNNVEPASAELRYNYSSLTTPNSVFTYNMLNGETKLLKEATVLGGFDKNNYETKRLWATAKDGTKVPISIVYRKGFNKDGNGKMLLYAYGSYGSPSESSFNSQVLSLLDRGFAYAIAHIRGGSEMGRQWYENGKLLHKINTFTDFNDCARFLIEEKYTSPSGLFAMGRSAGGLLMGAVINMEPELYQGVVAGVPFVDVVSTMLDASIPLTTFEWDEWGDPSKKEYYEYMLSYSPYDQVKAQNYPNLLVTTSFWDSQVQYWEPLKWVAKLRALKTDNNALYLYCNMNAGHGGASGRFEQLQSRAMEYAFILSLSGK